MTTTFLHEHLGLGPDGPEVKEHRFPLAADAIPSRKLSSKDGFSESDARSFVQARFADSNCLICDAIAGSEPHSVAEMAGVFWVAMRQMPEVLWFVPLDAQSAPATRLPQELLNFVTRLAGVLIGPYYFPDSGFLHSADIEHVDFDSQHRWWGSVDDSWKDAVAFFSTPTGRIFLYHPNGHIGIWENGSFRAFEDSLATFSRRFLDSMKPGAKDTTFW